MKTRPASSAIAVGLFAVASLAAWKAAEADGSVRYEPDNASSRLTVEGTSTIHDWTVEGHLIRGELIFQDIEPASLWTHANPFPQALDVTVHVEIPVDSLKSDNNGLNRRMYEALKADVHPTMTYRLERAEIRTGQTADASGSGASLIVETAGVLTVAGVDRTVDIPMQVTRLPGDGLEVSGETSLKMTEFGIEPPRAMLGALRTGDTVKVQWTWTLVPRHVDGSDDQ